MDEILGPLTFAVINGIVWGLLLSLLSLGLSLIYANLRWLNLAHGVFYMLGALVGWYLQASISFWGALAATPILTGSVGALSERIVLSRASDATAVLVIAIGLMLLLQGLAADLFGTAVRSVELPITGTIDIFNRQYSHYRLFAGALSLTLIVALWAFLKYTQIGLWIRAVAQDRQLALSQGIPVPAVYTLTFAIGVGLAGLSGVLFAPLIGVHPAMGMEILVIALIIVIAGRGPWGAVGIAVGLSLLENLLPSLSQILLGELLSPTLIRASLLSGLVVWLIFRAVSERES